VEGSLRLNRAAMQLSNAGTGHLCTYFLSLLFSFHTLSPVHTERVASHCDALTRVDARGRDHIWPLYAY